jgi:hypothetical protein
LEFRIFVLNYYQNLSKMARFLGAGWLICDAGKMRDFYFYRRERFLSALNFLRRAGRKLVQHVYIYVCHGLTPDCGDVFGQPYGLALR